MDGRTAKAKVSITLSKDLLARIDAEVERSPHLTRSTLIEQRLRRAERARAANALREETVRYYEALTEDERAEDEAIARGASKRARRVRYE